MVQNPEEALGGTCELLVLWVVAEVLAVVHWEAAEALLEEVLAAVGDSGAVEVGVLTWVLEEEVVGEKR